MRYAGFNKRSAAYTIDGFIIIALTYAVYYAMGGDAAQADELTDMVTQLQGDTQQYDAMNVMGMMDKMFGGGPSLLLATAVSAVYNIGFGVSRWHGTPGKHWRGLKIIKKDGSPLDLLTSTIRHAATGLSTLIFFIGFMMVGWTKEKTALHDLIAGTRVIYRD